MGKDEKIIKTPPIRYPLGYFIMFPHTSSKRTPENIFHWKGTLEGISSRVLHSEGTLSCLIYHGGTRRGVGGNCSDTTSCPGTGHATAQRQPLYDSRPTGPTLKLRNVRQITVRPFLRLQRGGGATWGASDKTSPSCTENTPLYTTIRVSTQTRESRARRAAQATDFPA